MWYPWEVIPITIEGFLVAGLFSHVYNKRKLALTRQLFVAVFYIMVVLCLRWMRIDFEIVAWCTIVLVIGLSVLVLEGSLSSKCFAAALTVLILFMIQYTVRYGCSLLFNQRWQGRSSQIVILSLNQAGTMTYYILIELCYGLIVWVLNHNPKSNFLFHKKEEWLLTGIILLSVSLSTGLFYGAFRYTSLHILEFCMITAVLFVLLFAFIMVFLFSSLLKQRNKQYQWEKVLLENQILSASYEQIVLKNKELMKLKHDFIKYLTVIRNMDVSDSHKFIDQLLNDSSKPVLKVYSGDPYIDAVINSKVDEMTENDITFQYSIDIPKPLNISPSDICIILFNLIENAIEACSKIDECKKRFIELSIRRKGQYVAIVCRNSVTLGSVTQAGLNHSTKKEQGHGFGLVSIRECAECNGGSITFDIEEEQVTIKVLLMEKTDYVADESKGEEI